ncbi:MAG: hypothetical protein ACYCQK_01420 [Acidiferrobacteraceae bacterium]
MPSIATWSAFQYTDNDGSTLSDGSCDVPVLINPSTTPVKYSNSLALAQNAKGTLWDSANSPNDFTYAEIKSDTGDSVNGWVVIELTTDENNTYGTQYFTIALLANVPLVLGSSSSYANYTANFGGGTLSKIQRVRVKNLNTATATVGIRLIQ